jgi:hypothetical protein
MANACPVREPRNSVEQIDMENRSNPGFRMISSGGHWDLRLSDLASPIVRPLDALTSPPERAIHVPLRKDCAIGDWAERGDAFRA